MIESDTRFGLDFRVLEDNEAEHLHTVKDLAAELYSRYEALGASTEITNAKSRLEEAAMWASKHIALNGVKERQ